MAVDEETAKSNEPSFAFYEHHFLASFYHVFNKFLGPEARTDILVFLIEDITSLSMYLSFTKGEMSTLMDMVFKSTSIRDFCLMLVSNFRFRIDQGNHEWECLVLRLGTSYFVNSVYLPSDPDNRMTPLTIASRLPESKAIYHYLDQNPWLVVLAMIDQVISLEHIQKMAPEAPSRRVKATLPIAGSG